MYLTYTYTYFIVTYWYPTHRPLTPSHSELSRCVLSRRKAARTGTQPVPASGSCSLPPGCQEPSCLGACSSKGLKVAAVKCSHSAGLATGSSLGGGELCPISFPISLDVFLFYICQNKLATLKNTVMWNLVQHYFLLASLVP